MVEKMKTIITNLQKYYGVYLLIVAMLFLILWFPNRAVNRYAISGDRIVDTRTGHTWERTRTTIMDLGTTNKPKWGVLERIKSEKPRDIFDEISGTGNQVFDLPEEAGEKSVERAKK
jgi:hypothetical protein